METKILEQHKNARTLSVRDACCEIIAEKVEHGILPQNANTLEVSKKLSLHQMIVNYEFGKLEGMGVAVCREGLNYLIIELKN